ncbi:MAG: electron transport complex subunit RsxG, partial [Gammaproteobacteria bacterium]|nr:electron transport complex subunit RsxG [Gammaproteobacteria bacterium]
MIKPATLPASLLLLLVASAIAVMTTWAWDATSVSISNNERNYRLRALNEIVPASRYDNNLFADTISVRDPELLGPPDKVTAYRARKDGLPVAVIITAVAPKGYSAAIKLMVGINFDGTIAGVRVSDHRETRGLGDQIEIENSDWITKFDQRSLGDPARQAWAVQRDGGVFDQISGATITPRAIVRAVRDALIYFEANRDTLFAMTPD